MQSAETVLGVLRERGMRGLPLNELYRQLFNPELYFLAYGNIYSNKGAMTPGPDGETADGMSRGKTGRIIDAMRHELPEHRLDIRRLRGYEHLDVLWGKNVHVDVIPQVAHALRQHCENPEMIRDVADGLKSKDNLLHPDAAYGYVCVDGGESGFTSDYATSTDA